MTFSIDQNEDEYFPRIKGYLIVLIGRLNEAMKGRRVSKATRRHICETFLFSHCRMLDQEWLRCEGKTSYPLIAFSKHFIDGGDSTIEDNSVLITDKGNELHAIAGEVVSEYFDELQEALPADITGEVGAELPDENFERVPEPRLRIPCAVCKGAGQCFCIRKGSGLAESCPRCGGHGRCQHCDGTGLSNP